MAIRTVILSAPLLIAGQALGDTHWSYEGETGPVAWGSLKAEYHACASGTVQSPIDIRRAEVADLSALELDYRPGPLTIENTGSTAKVQAPEGGTLTVGGDEYRLLQLHFHAPSEEAVAGRRYAADLHFVHADDDGELAVVGVLFEEGAANEVIETLWNALPAEQGSASERGVTFDPASLLPADGDYFTYRGSLTTPPCSEGVRWFVMTEPLTISKAQVDAYLEIFGETARPIQPANERRIQLYLD